jgi:hypothetical protein
MSFDRKTPVNRALRIAVPCLLAGAAAAAHANEAELLRCLTISDSTVRLACYDVVARALQPTERFGKERAAPAAAASAVEAIESHIPGQFDGWEARALIELANGQVWQVTDNSSGTARLVNPKVKVTRGLLGSFFMSIEGESRVPRVRRVR